MTKTQSILLEDYLRDKTDVRLSIFVGSLNPEFKLNKVSKEQIKLLISDYSLDRNRTRLKNIETFLSGGSEVKQVKVVGKKSAGIEQPKVNKLTSLLGEEKDQDTIELITLTNELKELRSRYMGNPNWSRIDDERRIFLLNRINEIEHSKGYFNDDPLAQEKTEIAMIKGTIGDWTDSRTAAYAMLYGNRPQFMITVPYKPEFLLEILKKHSGVEPRQFIIKSIIGGSVLNKTSIKGTTYQFTDNSSGLEPMAEPINQTQTVTMGV